jgi:hypothetical protein
MPFETFPLGIDLYRPCQARRIRRDEAVPKFSGGPVAWSFAFTQPLLQKTNFNPNRICRGLNAEVKLSGSPLVKSRSLRPVSLTVPAV